MTHVAPALALLSIAFTLLPLRAATYQQAPAEREAPPAAARDSATAELAQAVEDARARISADGTLTEELVQQATTRLQAAETALARTEELKTRADRERAAARDAESRAQQARSELETVRAKEPAVVDPATPLADLELRSIERNQELDRQREKVDSLQSKRDGRRASRQKLRQKLELAEETIASLTDSIRNASAEDRSLPATTALLETQAQLKQTEAEKESLNASMARYDAEDVANLIRDQLDLETARLRQIETEVAALDAVIADQRKRLAAQTADAAVKKEESIRKKHPRLAASYSINTAIAKRASEVEARVEAMTARRNNLRDRVETLNQLKRETETRVNNIGLTGPIGAMLRKRRAEMNEQIPFHLDSEAVEDELNEIQFEDFEKEEQREQLSPEVIRREIESAKDENGRTSPISDKEFERLADPVSELIAIRKDKLSLVDESLDRLFKQLLNIQDYEHKLKVITSDFREYANERILWIRSNDVLLTSLEIDEGDRALISRKRWADAMQRLYGLIKRWPVFYGVSSLLILTLLILKPRMRRRIDQLGEAACKGSCETFWPTVHSLVLSSLVALIIPLIPLVLGLGILWVSPSENPLFDALGKGLLATAWFAIPMEILRRMCRPKGLANQHFDWPNSAVKRLKENLDWLILPGSILVFLNVLVHELELTHRVDLIERLLFVASMVLFAWFLHRTFHPVSGIFSPWLKEHENSWANQTSTLWFGCILMLPAILAGLTIWGYYFTALNLASCTYATFVFALIVETVRAILRRLILLRRRRVHIKAARRKRELQIQAQKENARARRDAQNALRASQAAAAGISPETVATKSTEESAALALDSLVELQPADDIDENALRATKLISLVMIVVWALGMWMIWTDVLPALKALDNYTVWPGETIAAGMMPVAESDAGEPDASEPTPMDPTGAMTTTNGGSTTRSARSNDITIGDLLMFSVIAIVTVLSARNLPSAIEMLFLDHLPLDRSFRYATKSLVSYGIVMLGMVLAFNVLSIRWDNVQWLATALTFGLAFGLQEIFANFVAGIILMFERPVRIGDWITVDDYTGVVTRIRTRATTIVNLDRKEYVIPNKDFITGRLVNWTLSDAINRIIIKVGVAYGSDVVAAKAILKEVCNNHPKTVADPPTNVAFEEFADSSLSLTVRTFIGDVESRVLVIDELHTQIYQAFGDAGIEISFPQRDLHIRSIDPAAARELNAGSPKPVRQSKT